MPLTLGELQYYTLKFVAVVLSLDSVQHICQKIIHIRNRSLFRKKIYSTFCPALPFAVKLVTTTTFVVYIFLHGRTISHSESQVGHMKSGRPDEQSSWAHFRHN